MPFKVASWPSLNFPPKKLDNTEPSDQFSLSDHKMSEAAWLRPKMSEAAWVCPQNVCTLCVAVQFFGGPFAHYFLIHKR